MNDSKIIEEYKDSVVEKEEQIEQLLKSETQDAQETVSHKNYNDDQNDLHLVHASYVEALEASWNMSLQNAIEECLMELMKRGGYPGPVFDMMATTLEKVSTVPITARATIGAMFILAQIIASVSDQSYVQRGFSDALFHQLLQAMLHPDVQTHITAHQIFAVILVPTSVSPRSECQSFQSVSQYDSKRALSKPTSAFSSAAALFEKLGKEKVGLQEEKSGSYTSDS